MARVVADCAGGPVGGVLCRNILGMALTRDLVRERFPRRHGHPRPRHKRSTRFKRCAQAGALLAGVIAFLVIGSCSRLSRHPGGNGPTRHGHPVDRQPASSRLARRRTACRYYGVLRDRCVVGSRRPPIRATDHAAATRGQRSRVVFVVASLHLLVHQHASSAAGAASAAMAVASRSWGWRCFTLFRQSLAWQLAIATR